MRETLGRNGPVAIVSIAVTCKGMRSIASQRELLTAVVLTTVLACSEPSADAVSASTNGVGGGQTASASSAGGAGGAGSGSGGSGGTIAVEACATPPEGYGVMSSGGDGGDEYHVSSLADSGAGSLRNGITNRVGPRRIVFDVAGVIVLSDAIHIGMPFLTIDGCSAPPPGITLTSASPSSAVLGILGTHDVIVRNLRIQGLWQPGQSTMEGTADLFIDGDSNPDHVARNIFIDHMSLTGGNDAAFDMWGEVQDVTFSWSFLYENARGGLISHYPAPYQVRQRISYHHNVYSKNTERNPQIRADVRDLDYVNNILHDWGFFDPMSGYGIRIRNDGTEPPVHGNFINNAFASSIQPASAFVDAGNGSQLYLSGNVFPPAFTGDPSTLSAPLPVPAGAQIAAADAPSLVDVVLPLVGVRDRNEHEATLLAEIADALQP